MLIHRVDLGEETVRRRDGAELAVGGGVRVVNDAVTNVGDVRRHVVATRLAAGWIERGNLDRGARSG